MKWGNIAMFYFLIWLVSVLVTVAVVKLCSNKDE